MTGSLLVIGSNSFSGATFVDYALAQGASVIGTSRSPEPVRPFLPYAWHDPSKLSFHQLDLNQSFPAVVELLHREKPEYVINFAAQSMVAESWQHPADWFMTNCVSTVKLHD